ncbi:MerR family transcriptional regulator [Streptomyces sp. NPDC059070]|uniref:MerR family transcriptional regulator n=1 Tax=unclassified Streptomyces TaxID=2593676 RepID=UPI0034E2CC89
MSTDRTPGSVPSEDVGVTTGVLARRLGVSPMTIRSWDRRYGLGPAQRQSGHHRRWRAADIALVEEMCRLTALGVPPAEAARAAKAASVPGGVPGPRSAPARQTGPPSAGSVRPETRGLARASVRLNAPAVQARLNAFLQEHGVVTAWEEMMMPALYAVGRKWEAGGDRYVEVEHMLSWSISTALRSVPLLLPCPPPPPEAAPALLACLPDEQHTLPLEALEGALRERGAAVRILGGAVPTEALTAAVRRTGPEAVVLWSQTRSTASFPLAQHLAGTHWGMRGARRGPVVLLAGPGWGHRTGTPGLPRPRSLVEALNLLSRKASSPGPTVR